MSEHLKPRCLVIDIQNPMIVPDPAPVYASTSKTILSSGRLTYQKGFDMLVDVAAQVLPQHPGWQWLILGEGEDRSNARGQDSPMRASASKLILKGRVPDTDSYYRKSAFFFRAHLHGQKGLPMVLLEARAYGLPIVSFDCPTGPSEIIEDALNGNLVRPDDITAMAEERRSPH